MPADEAGRTHDAAFSAPTTTASSRTASSASYAAATQLGDVTVVAPDREQSATSHSLTLHHPLRPVRAAERRYQVDGTPTDCVMLAVEALMPERPDFVLSGINHGQNMGEDVLYSGTVAAAMEGLSLGIPSDRRCRSPVATSAPTCRELDEQIDVLVPLLRHLTSLPAFPARHAVQREPAAGGAVATSRACG